LILAETGQVIMISFLTAIPSLSPADISKAPVQTTQFVRDGTIHTAESDQDQS